MPTSTKPVVIESLLSVNEVAAALGCVRRTLERLRSTGAFPKPDLQVGRCPRWKASTINAWIAQGGAR